MGCDGGTIPRRDELVKTKKKEEQKDKDAEAVAKWKHCAITQEKLKSPIVSCELGRLYSKEAVLEYLLNKDQSCEVAKHIRSLRDVVELNLTQINGFKEKEADLGDVYIDRQASRYICPVAGLELNGKHKFCYLRKCGCVLSERALKEVKSENCHKCGKPFDDDDLIILNGTDEEVDILRSKMEIRRFKAKQEKKAKKHKLEGTETSTASGSGLDTKKIKSEPLATKTTVNAKRNGQDLKATKIVNTTNKLNFPEQEKMAKSIAKNPNASEAFKSLFTSHPKAQNQQKAHWVTHNPCFY